MASLHFQAAAAHRGMPLLMLGCKGRARRLPKVLALLLGRYDEVDVSEAIEVPAPIWPALPADAGPQPATSRPQDDGVGAADAAEAPDDAFGWHDSSFALQEGLDVAECQPADLPADLPLGEWLKAYLV